MKEKEDYTIRELKHLEEVYTQEFHDMIMEFLQSRPLIEEIALWKDSSLRHFCVYLNAQEGISCNVKIL